MKKYKYCGFTLIELLAVIVILSIIALIATPIVLNIIEDTKVSSIKTSSELYMNAVELSLGRAGIDNVDISTCKVENKILKCGDKEYKIEIKVEHPDEVEIKATQSGKIYTAMKRDNYCIMIKEGENSLSYKKIVNIVKDSNNEITNNNCTLDPYTSENCFAFDGTTGTITDYYNYENNGKKQNECPRDVLIPSKINNIEVTTIGNSAFRNKNITSVEIPSSVVTVDGAAFMNNDIVNLKLSDGLTTINQSAFNDNEITTVEIPNSVTTIGPYAFTNNNITNVTIKNKQENVILGSKAFGTFDTTNIVWDYLEQ